MEQTILNALRVAAVQYAIDAMTAKATPRIAEQFTRQAREAASLADRIEEHGLCCVAESEHPARV